MTARKVWADIGPSLDECPTNPNEHVFSLVVEAGDYDQVVDLLRRVAANIVFGDLPDDPSKDDRIMALCREIRDALTATPLPADSAPHPAP